MIGHAVDVSHWQSSIPGDAHRPPQGAGAWTSACIVRGAYGTTPDRRTRQHWVDAVQRFDRVGLYFFFRPDQPVERQLRAWIEIAWDLYGPTPTEQLLPPVLDAESEPHRPLAPDHLPAIVAALQGLELDFGAWPLLYINRSDFALLGRPSLLQAWPWWLAQYSEPLLVPRGANVVMHQHLVAPWAGPRAAAGFRPVAEAIDHSRILAPLPRMS